MRQPLGSMVSRTQFVLYLAKQIFEGDGEGNNLVVATVHLHRTGPCFDWGTRQNLGRAFHGTGSRCELAQMDS